MSIPPMGGGDLDYVQSLVDCFFLRLPYIPALRQWVLRDVECQKWLCVTDKVQYGSCGIHIKQEVSFERKFVGSAFP